MGENLKPRVLSLNIWVQYYKMMENLQKMSQIRNSKDG